MNVEHGGNRTLFPTLHSGVLVGIIGNLPVMFLIKDVMLSLDAETASLKVLCSGGFNLRGEWHSVVPVQVTLFLTEYEGRREIGATAEE